jgi:hypothetical protein
MSAYAPRPAAAGPAFQHGGAPAPAGPPLPERAVGEESADAYLPLPAVRAPEAAGADALPPLPLRAGRGGSAGSSLSSSDETSAAHWAEARSTGRGGCEPSAHWQPAGGAAATGADPHALRRRQQQQQQQAEAGRPPGASGSGPPGALLEPSLGPLGAVSLGGAAGAPSDVVRN